MRLSLFEALRIERDASESAVRASLRRLIRRMYASTRDVSGDVEEGLRFCNAASSVLLDKTERQHYESEYTNLSAGSLDSRRSHSAIDSLATNPGGLPNVQDEAAAAANGTTSVRPGLMGMLEIVGAASASTGYFTAVLVGAIAVAAVIVFFALHNPLTTSLQQLLLLGGLTAVGAAAGMAIHRTRERGEQKEVAARLRDVPIVKWRRERSVFMGSRLRNEEAAWVYRLRVAETDRARNIRSSQASILLRLAARVVDYGLWGGVLVLLVSAAAAITGAPTLRLLNAWWALPIVTILTFIPIEASLLHRFRCTPGKWLFGLRCRPGMTALLAPDARRESSRYSLLRAIGAAVFGMGGGLPLLNLLAPMTGTKTRSTENETRWDAMGDSILTQSPLSSKQAGVGAATLLLLTSSYLMLWWPSVAQTGAIVKEARQLAPQVSWGGLLSVNPKTWIPAEVLNPKDWKAAEKLSDVTQTVTNSVGSAASGVAAKVTGKSNEPVAAPAVPPSALKAKFDAYTVQVEKALAAGSPAAAMPICSKWVNEEPNNALAWKCYGLGLQAEFRHAEALQALRRSQKLNPQDTSLYNPIRISFSSINDRAPPRERPAE